jgi:hypothetical protein
MWESASSLLSAAMLDSPALDNLNLQVILLKVWALHDYSILRCTSFAMQHQIDTIAWDSCAALQAFKNSAALGWGSSTWIQTVRQTCQILPNIYWFYCRSKHGTNLGQRQTSESQTLGRSAVITDLDTGNVSSSHGSKCFASAFHYYHLLSSTARVVYRLHQTDPPYNPRTPKDQHMNMWQAHCKLRREKIKNNLCGWKPRALQIVCFFEWKRSTGKIRKASLAEGHM